MNIQRGIMLELNEMVLNLGPHRNDATNSLYVLVTADKARGWWSPYPMDAAYLHENGWSVFKSNLPASYKEAVRAAQAALKEEQTP